MFQAIKKNILMHEETTILHIIYIAHILINYHMILRLYIYIILAVKNKWNDISKIFCIFYTCR